MKIKLKTIEDVTNFTSVCKQYNECNIDVKQGRQTIDGKSILGIFSLNLLLPIDVFADSKDENASNLFYKEMEKWEVIEE